MKTKSRLFKVSFIALLFMAVLHLISIRFYLYWSFWWLDMIVHFFGGFFVAGMALYFLLPYLKTNKRLVVFTLGVFVLTVAVLWEVFEFHFGIIVISRNFYFDTFSDIFMDIVGAVVVLRYVLFLE